jgi:hypothetical protein
MNVFILTKVNDCARTNAEIILVVLEPLLRVVSLDNCGWEPLTTVVVHFHCSVRGWIRWRNRQCCDHDRWSHYDAALRHWGQSGQTLRTHRLRRNLKGIGSREAV